MAKLRVLIAGVIALGIAMAIPSQAAAAFLEAEKMPASLSASQTNEHVFSIEGGLSAKCKKATFAGTLSEASNAVSLTPTYSECTAFGLAATVTTTGCKFVLNPEMGAESETYPSTMDVSCEAGKAITIATTSCEVQIGAQTGLGTVKMINNASSPKDVTFELAIEKAVYNKTKDGALCPLSGTGVKEDGKLTGSSLLIGKVAEAKVWIQIVQVTVLCTENKEPCGRKKEFGLKTLLEGNATDFKLVANFDDGKGVVKDITISCAKARLTGTTQKYGSVINRALVTNLETFSTEGCLDENKAECTVDGRVLPSVGELIAVANGNGLWTTPVKIRVICGTQKLNCDYGKAVSFDFQGDATAAKLKAPGLALDWEKRPGGGGEEDCGNKAAKMTANYTLNKAAFLRTQ